MTAACLTLTVDDSAPGVRARLIARVVRPLFRGDRARQRRAMRMAGPQQRTGPIHRAQHRAGAWRHGHGQRLAAGGLQLCVRLPLIADGTPLGAATP